jgi:hypothetical protein
MTLHPEGRQGVNTVRHKNDAIRDAIVAALEIHGELTFEQLTGRVDELLSGEFDGSVSWYVSTVKLDLEARGIVATLRGKGPQRLRLASE